MESGYDKIYSTVLGLLKEREFIQNGIRLGGWETDGGLGLSFLGRDYKITEDGVEPMDGKPTNVNNLSIIIYYVTSAGYGDVLNDFAPLNRLSGMHDGQNTLTGGVMTPLQREFSDDYEGFAHAVRGLGGIEIPAPSSGKHVWQLRPLPKILCQLIFYEKDEEFPADIQLMLDRSAPRFLEFECLAFMTGAMAGAILAAYRKGA
jgi:hypothetical protein